MVISQVYTDVIVDGTPSDVMEATPRPSYGTFTSRISALLKGL